MAKRPSDDQVRAELRDVFDAVAHRTTATYSAFTGAPVPETTPPPRWDRDPAERRTLWTALAAAAAAVVLLVGLVAVRATRDDVAISTIDTGPQPSEYPTSPVPAGWQTVDFGDLRLSVPGDWAVLHQPDRGSGGGCPTATPTVVLGGGSGPCPTPSSPPRLVSLVRFAGDCDNTACGERSDSGAVRPDIPITKLDSGHGVRVASSDHYGEQCDTCLSVVMPDLGVLAHFTRIDQATASSILDTIDRSARWRALHEGPFAATTNWQTVDAAGATKMSAPNDWPIVHVSDNPTATVPWQCTDGFAESNARTVIVNDRPTTKASCSEMAVGSAVDALYIRPSQPDAYDLSPGDSTSSNGATVTILGDIYPGTSTIELRIERPGTPAARVSIGVSTNPIIARTILHTLGRDSAPTTAQSPTTARATTADTTPAASPSPSTAPTANTATPGTASPTVTLPAGWYTTTERYAPYLADPREVYSAATYPLPAPGTPTPACDGQIPKAPLEAMPPDGAFVWLLVSGADSERRNPNPGDTKPPRPASFTLGSLPQTDCGGYAVRMGWYSIDGRTVGITIALGPSATPDRVRELETLVGSIRFS
jgi:hypothetical protein